MKAKQAKGGKETRAGGRHDHLDGCAALYVPVVWRFVDIWLRSSHVFARSLAICCSDFGSYPAPRFPACVVRLAFWWAGMPKNLSAYLFTFVTYLLVFALTMAWKFYVFWQFKILKDVKPSYVRASIDSTSIHFAVFILRSWVASLLVATCRIRAAEYTIGRNFDTFSGWFALTSAKHAVSGSNSLSSQTKGNAIKRMPMISWFDDCNCMRLPLFFKVLGSHSSTRHRELEYFKGFVGVFGCVHWSLREVIAEVWTLRIWQVLTCKEGTVLCLIMELLDMLVMRIVGLAWCFSTKLACVLVKHCNLTMFFRFSQGFALEETCEHSFAISETRSGVPAWQFVKCESSA